VWERWRETVYLPGAEQLAKNQQFPLSEKVLMYQTVRWSVEESFS
jgi:hypothetical protein